MPKKTLEELQQTWRDANPGETVVPDWYTNDLDGGEQYQQFLMAAVLHFTANTNHLCFEKPLVALRYDAEPTIERWPGIAEVMRRLSIIMRNEPEWNFRWDYALRHIEIVINEYPESASASILCESAIRDAYQLMVGEPWEGIPDDMD